VCTDIIDSPKTFVFAGHDTSLSTICWIFYMLHFHPEVYTKLKAELDNIFPPEKSTADALKVDPWLLNRMEYAGCGYLRNTTDVPPSFDTTSVPPS
jgi:cytochrome P450